MTVKVKLQHPSFFRRLDQMNVNVDLTPTDDIALTGHTEALQPQHIEWMREHKTELIDDLKERDGCLSALRIIVDSALVWQDLEDAIARALDLWTAGCIPRSYVENVSLAAQEKARDIPCSWDNVKLKDLAQATGRKLMINSRLFEQTIGVVSDDLATPKDGYGHVVYTASELAKINGVSADELRSIHAVKEQLDGELIDPPLQDTIICAEDLIQRDQGDADTCPACGKITWWFKDSGQRICGVCHPKPQKTKTERRLPLLVPTK